MFQFIRGIISDFGDLLFPNLCIGCYNTLEPNEKILCPLCRINLPETNYHKGLNALIPLNKFAGKVPVEFVLPYLHFTKGGVVQKLIHLIKYKGQKEVAKEIGYWYGSQLNEESDCAEDIDLLIGVPLHESRLAQRGYNQADWIAMGVAESLSKPVRTDVLIRNSFKESQTNKSRIDRWENVRTVFSVVNEAVIRDKRVVLVDDVLTTGATIEACALELIKAGCKSVGVLTLAVTK